MIAPTPSEPTSRHALANAIERVQANIARRADAGKQAEREHVPGAKALDRLQANAARIEAKRAGATEAERRPEPGEPLPAPEPEVTRMPSPEPGRIELARVSPMERWSTARFEITA